MTYGEHQKDTLLRPACLADWTLPPRIGLMQLLRSPSWDALAEETIEEMSRIGTIATLMNVRGVIREVRIARQVTVRG